MDKTEYKKIINYLDEGKIDELRKYLDDRMNLKELKNVKKVLMNLLESDYYRRYPSYTQRLNGEGKMKKVYNGIFEKTENGIIVFHENSNLFELYNTEILNTSLENMMEYNRDYYNENVAHKVKRGDMLDRIQEGLDGLDDRYYKEVAYLQITDDRRYVRLFNKDEKLDVLVPNRYYTIAHQLIGDNTDEYLDSNGTGVYMKSAHGRALIMRMDVKTK